MINRLKERLELLGFPPETGDADVMEGLLSDASRKVMAEIGICSLPEGLESLVIDLAAGQYLFIKKAAGTLQGFDGQMAIKQLQEGDTSVTYAIGDGARTPEERLDMLVENLRTIPPGLAAAWRKMRW